MANGTENKEGSEVASFDLQVELANKAIDLFQESIAEGAYHAHRASPVVAKDGSLILIFFEPQPAGVGGDRIIMQRYQHYSDRPTGYSGPEEEICIDFATEFNNGRIGIPYGMDEGISEEVVRGWLAKIPD